MSDIIILSLIGVVISLYAFIEFMKLNNDENYKPLCDFSQLVSCSRAFLSRFGRGFGVPNPFVGVVYYLIIIMLYSWGLYLAVAYATIIVLLFTLFYAYLLYFKVKSICVVCTAIYVINILLFLYATSLAFWV